jgi:hypothetical protein
MPNWCNNNLVLEHDFPEMLIRAKDALDRGEFLQEFIPVPQDLRDTVSGFMGEDKRAAHEAQMEANKAKHGYKDWYDFCVNEWGTKWDTGEQGNTDISPDGKTLHTGFDTAWAPPCAAYEKLMDLGFRVKAMYYEPGMSFAGIWEDGHDDCYQDWGDSEGAKATLPAELDDCFGISESQAEYEAENEDEELTEWIRDGAEKRSELKVAE